MSASVYASNWGKSNPIRIPIKVTFDLIKGMPVKEGWYLIKLMEDNRKFDVDYCMEMNGKLEWTNWYPKDISHYAHIPE